MSTQKGTFGVVWALVTGVSATGLGTCQVQSADFGVESDLKEIKGADGDTKCIIFSDSKESLTIEVVPSGATIAAAKTASILPVPGADVAITDADDSEVVGSAGASNRWHFISGSKRKTIEGEVRLTMTLRRYATDLPTIAAS